eukprot:CAMPEP_0184297248 /NCGR_PEP_ID=MMETSP1049-20130417/8187_1 /TAXON_ID=77928 /ORGANISM="Proteomonas sulcata, Strain CCMP704" /LENGTH=204 /DNA_ID=CAMNT_0026606897 /DNA_START=150 /DNA_END=764 /DNA_ORIENTATION=+
MVSRAPFMFPQPKTLEEGRVICHYPSCAQGAGCEHIHVMCSLCKVVVDVHRERIGETLNDHASKQHFWISGMDLLVLRREKESVRVMNHVYQAIVQQGDTDMGDLDLTEMQEMNVEESCSRLSQIVDNEEMTGPDAQEALDSIEEQATQASDPTITDNYADCTRGGSPNPVSTLKKLQDHIDNVKSLLQRIQTHINGRVQMRGG